MTTESFTLTTHDGRYLDVTSYGDPSAPVVVSHHGTPSGHVISGSTRRAADEHGLRILAFARPGYAESTRRPGRTVASIADDVAAVLDAVGADQFATVGASGGGPHALACGALLADRCTAVATIAGAGPFDMDGVDFLGGMGEDNVIEFNAAVAGEAELRPLLTPWRVTMIEAGPQGTYEALRTVLCEPDREVFTGEVATELHRSASVALRHGIDGWVDDDLAFVQPWGFAPSDVKPPVFLWQGEQDLMVPQAHGRWLAGALPHCTPRFEPSDGHLTIGIRRITDVLADLAAALS